MPSVKNNYATDIIKIVSNSVDRSGVKNITLYKNSINIWYDGNNISNKEYVQLLETFDLTWMNRHEAVMLEMIDHDFANATTTPFDNIKEVVLNSGISVYYLEKIGENKVIMFDSNSEYGGQSVIKFTVGEAYERT